MTAPLTAARRRLMIAIAQHGPAPPDGGGWRLPGTRDRFAQAGTVARAQADGLLARDPDTGLVRLTGAGRNALVAAGAPLAGVALHPDALARAPEEGPCPPPDALTLPLAEDAPSARWPGCP